jgi:hypothetical protein
MDSDYIQHVRYKLQKRLKRLNTADFRSLHFTLVQVWDFLQRNDITKGILDDLEKQCAALEDEAVKTINALAQVGFTEAESCGISYWVVKKCAAVSGGTIEIQIGLKLIAKSEYDAAIEAFRFTYVEPLFDYIDEHLDDKRMTLVLLRKYKHRCEWFRRDALRDACNAETRNGEKTLA